MKKLHFFLAICLTSIFLAMSQNLEHIPKTQKEVLRLRQELESINVKDQTLRLILPDIEKKFGFNSDEYKYVWTLIHHQDSINTTVVLNILDTYGWVGKSIVGEKANQALWLVIQHAPIDIQETYLPLLAKSVKNGESSGWHLAFLEDRILLRRGEKQKYGTQAKRNEETGSYYIHSIADEININVRRQKIGLEPIEIYADKNGYLLKKD